MMQSKILQLGFRDKLWVKGPRPPWQLAQIVPFGDFGYGHVGLGQIVDNISTVVLETMLIYFIDKIWTKIGHFFVQGLSNVKNLTDIF